MTANPPRLLDRIDRPQDLHALDEDQLAQVAREVRAHIIDTVGEIGGHFGANLGTCELAVALHSLLDSPRDKVLWDVGHQAYPHKVLTGRRDQLPTIRQYEGLAPFCSIRGVRARHHGRRPRLDRDRLRGRPQGGHAPARRVRRRQGRRGRRRRRDDRRRRVRGDPPGGRPRHADRRRPQRQRHVDRAERRRDVALLQPRPAEPEALARPRGRRGPARRPARHRRRVRAPRAAAQGVDQGVLGARALVGGARLGLRRRRRRPRRPRPASRAARRADGRPPRRRPRLDRQGHAASPRPRTAASRAWRSGTPRSRSRSPTALRPRRSPRRSDARAAAVHRGVRRGADRRGPPRPPRRRDHRRDELRHRPEPPAEGRARALLRRRHRRAAGGPVRRRPGARGPQAGLRDLLDVPPARVRPDRPRRLPAAAQRRVRDGPRRPRRRRRPDAPRRVRHRLPALPAEHRPHGPARRGDARRACCAPR